MFERDDPEDAGLLITALRWDFWSPRPLDLDARLFFGIVATGLAAAGSPLRRSCFPKAMVRRLAALDDIAQYIGSSSSWQRRSSLQPEINIAVIAGV